jgi:hypothetical protein
MIHSRFTGHLGRLPEESYHPSMLLTYLNKTVGFPSKQRHPLFPPLASTELLVGAFFVATYPFVLVLWYQ